MLMLAALTGGCRTAYLRERVPKIPAMAESPHRWASSFRAAEVATVRFFRDSPLVAATDGHKWMPAVEPADARTVFSFVHLSDAQLRDERLRFELRGFGLVGLGAASEWFADCLVETTSFAPDQERFDTSVLLSTIRGWGSHERIAADRAGKVSPEEHALFAIHTGDAIHVRTVAELEEYAGVCRETYLPILQCYGNHDVMNFGSRVGSAVVDSTDRDFGLVDRPLFLAADEGRTSPFSVQRRDGSSIGPFPFLAGGLPPRPRPSGENPRMACVAERSAGSVEVGDGCGMTLAGGDRAKGGRGFYSFVVRGDGRAFGREWESERFQPGLAFRIIVLDTCKRVSLTALGDLDEPIEPEVPAQEDADDGVVPDSQAQWIEDEMAAAERMGQYVIAFGHHSIRDRALRGALSHFIRGDTDEGFRRAATAFARYKRFLAYFCGHTHVYSWSPSVAAEGAGFWEVIAPAIIEYPQAALFVRVRATPGADPRIVLDVDPFASADERVAETDVERLTREAELPRAEYESDPVRARAVLAAQETLARRAARTDPRGPPFAHYESEPLPEKLPALRLIVEPR